MNSFVQKKIGGDGKVVQIYESLFRGKRKNNKGRYLLGDLVDLDIDNPKRGKTMETGWLARGFSEW